MELNKEIIYKYAKIIFITVNPLAVLLLSQSAFITIISFVVSLFVIYYLNTRKGWPYVIFINVLLILSIIIYSETIFRYLFKEKNIPVIYQAKDKYYFNIPNLKETFITAEFATIFCTDCNGYRINPIKDPHESITDGTILFIGDSFTQGAQVGYSEMYSSIIQENLSTEKIINAGISGAGIVDEYYYYIEEGANFHCETVVLQLGVFNDFCNVIERSANFESKYLMKSHLYSYFKNQIFSNNVSPKLSRWAEPFEESIQGNVDFNIMYKATSEVKERDKRNFEKTLKAFNTAVQNNGGHLVVMLIPSKEQVSNDCLTEVLTTYGLNINDLDLLYPNNWLKEKLNEINVDFIDMYEDFVDSESFPYFNIDEHINVQGHKLVANRFTSYWKNTKQ